MSLLNCIEKGVFNRIAKAVYLFFERLGVHITPSHYYMPIPNSRELRDDLWDKQTEMTGIDLRDEAQIELLKAFAADYSAEYGAFPREKTSNPNRYYLNCPDFGPVDGEILYCMIRHFKPKKMMEIGSGYSTLLSAQAARKNAEEGAECEFIAVEPYPREFLKAGIPGLSRFIQARVQEVPLSEFEDLREGDILFIDSSHVLKIGGDVQCEYLEILPRLKRGVIVHIHDIFLPQEYPKEWVRDRFRFWNEQYLLQAFLAFNDSFEVLWAGNYMNLKHPEPLKRAFPTYVEGITKPGSFWVRKTK